MEEDDSEVKQMATVNKIVVSEYLDVTSILEKNVSSWFKLVSVLAQVIRFIKVTQAQAKEKKKEVAASDPVKETDNPVSSFEHQTLHLSDFKDAELKALQLTQQKYLSREVNVLNKEFALKLHPNILDETHKIVY